ncbi:DNA primase [Spiroplasma gladiatoris]|uniref:DNA primase n=1 Tax=Spiroplasma gladiatoris TaxID=2143 RepID=A0A4P7AHG6_9MOLU|nr:DNA primase [Spiroplasma gladiatoris]QBQ07894.1 DNA primase [Spiroplasma gladiatoris]
MAISQQSIDNIIQTVNIVDVINDYIVVQKKGRNYLAVCPFHNDSDPSLNISPDKKIFKCFVCGTGGNVISFIQEFENVTFFKALSILANKLKIKIDGLVIRDSKPRYPAEVQNIFNINKFAQEFFMGMFITKHAKLARQYLKKRYITNAELSKFEIGYCPRDVDLYEVLINKGYEKKDIDNSNLFYKKGVNNRCVFENRIIFPLADENNNIIGFSGRAYLKEDQPKYKNSSENLVFKKSQLAYNFANAKKQIRVNDEVIILEGFMDVISLERIGIENSIAIMGTSFSDYHIKLMSKYTKNFKLFLDGDKAGLSATLKAAKFLMDKSINVKIIENKTNKDPDELVVGGEVNLIKDMIKLAYPPIEFAIHHFKEQYDFSNPSQVKEFVEIIVDLINHERDQVTRESSLTILSDLTKLDKEVIRKYIKEPQKVFGELNVPIEYENNNFNINYEDLSLDNQYGNNQNGFYIDNVYEEVKTQNINKYEKFYIDRLLKQAEVSKSFAEASLVLSLIKNDEHLEQIENDISLIDDQAVKTILKTIIDEYRSDNYHGNSFDQIANKIFSINKKYYESLFNMNNKLFLHKVKNITKKAIKDMFSNIEQYKYLRDISNLNKELHNSKDLETKKRLAELIEKLIILSRKTYNKGGN